MKLHFLLALAATGLQAAPSVESLKADSLGMLSMPAFRFAAHVQPSAPDQRGEAADFFQDPKPAPLLRDSKSGDVLARMPLAAQLDKHRSLLRLKLGARDWDVSVAGDAGFKNYYLTLRDGAELRLAPLGDINRLRNEGIDITVESGVVYNVHLSVNIFSPVRGSTLQFRPVRGTRGPEYGFKSGAVLDAVRDRSLVFSADGSEYWGLYGTDVDPAAGRPAATRSFLFIHMDGLSSKAWPLAESALALGQPTLATFKSALALTRSDAELTIAKPR